MVNRPFTRLGQSTGAQPSAMRRGGPAGPLFVWVLASPSEQRRAVSGHGRLDCQYTYRCTDVSADQFVGTPLYGDLWAGWRNAGFVMLSLGVVGSTCGKALARPAARRVFEGVARQWPLRRWTNCWGQFFVGP
jgi:hypothetical protein